jgi:uncharacterized membrane protein YkvA (DUF1232 family)
MDPAEKAPAAKKTPAAKKLSPVKTTPAAKKVPTAKTTPAKETPAKATPAKATPALKGTSGGRFRKRANDDADPAGGPTSRFFRRARVRAQELVEDPEALQRLAQESTESGAARSGPFANVMGDFLALGRLVVAYSRGHYRDVQLDALILAVAALLYVLSPLDLIPDFVPAGYADDAVVVAWVIRRIRGELDAFRKWEQGGGSQ